MPSEQERRTTPRLRMSVRRARSRNRSVNFFGATRRLREFADTRRGRWQFCSRKHMDGQGRDTGMEKLFRGFFFLACGAFSIAAILYVARFSPGSHCFSQNPADWAEFGEYLGGTLGAIFGLFAFIGVLITIVQQRSQLDQQRSQLDQQREQSARDDQQTASRFY